ncbi:hypothetical protein M758_2G076000 [Ceratodon purpureus]|nr:hypothetical protein M758_2G076000 [Ceratodon purpureus]
MAVRARIPCSRCARNGNGNGNGCTTSAPCQGWSCPRHDWTWIDVNAYMPLWGAFGVPFCAGLLDRHATRRVVAGEAAAYVFTALDCILASSTMTMSRISFTIFPVSPKVIVGGRHVLGTLS